MNIYPKYKTSPSGHLMSASIGLASIMFLWNYQLPVGGMGVPAYFLILPVVAIYLGVKQSDFLKYVILFGTIGIYSLAQLLQGVEFLNVNRTSGSLVLLPLVVVLVSRWIKIIIARGIPAFFWIIRLMLISQLTLQFVQVILWYLGLQTARYMSPLGFPLMSGFFSEPSHVAVSLAPLVYWFVCYSQSAINLMGKKARTTLVIVAMLSACTTWLAVLVVAAFLKWIRSLDSIGRLIRAGPALLVVATLVFASVNYVDSIQTRVIALAGWINGGGEYNHTENLSALVFIKGAQMAWSGIRDFPLGVGLSNFAYLNDKSEVSHLSDTLYALNADDGSSLAFKLIGEFGFVGLLIVVVFISYSLILVRRTDVISMLLGGYVFAVIACFIRGMSYFDGAVIIGFSSLILAISGYQKGLKSAFDWKRINGHLT